MYKYKDKLLTPEEEKALFGYNALEGIPEEMGAWTLGWRYEEATDYGQYVVVGVEPAWIEMHHQADVLNEHGDPLPGVWVIFSMPGNTNNPINLMPRVQLWDRYSMLTGNAQRTNRMGYAQHTYGSGGEEIFVWDIHNDRLELPCPTITSSSWIGTEDGGHFIHTGIKVTFQRRRHDVEPQGRRLDRIEATIQEAERKLEVLESSQTHTDGIDALAAEITAIKEMQGLTLENLKLKVELLETKVANLTS
ncbi:MAG: hypothetical protein AAF485_14360 [Chloroflexota bacterium]